MATNLLGDPHENLGTSLNDLPVNPHIRKPPVVNPDSLPDRVADMIDHINGITIVCGFLNEEIEVDFTNENRDIPD
jgi:hypothetical protein